MQEKKYISQFGKEYDISFKVKKDIPDTKSYLYRFQVYIGDNAFGCDFIISSLKINKYKLIEIKIINICFNLIYKILNRQIEEYCSIRIGEKNIIEYLAVQDNIETN